MFQIAKLWVYSLIMATCLSTIGCSALIHSIAHVAGSKEHVDVRGSLKQRSAEILRSSPKAQSALALDVSDFDLLYTLPDGSVLLGLVEMKSFGSSWNSFRPEPRSLLRIDPVSMKILWRRERKASWPALSQVLQVSKRLVLGHSNAEKVWLDEIDIETGKILKTHRLPQRSRVLALSHDMIWYSLVTDKGLSLFRQKWGDTEAIRVGDVDSSLVVDDYLVVTGRYRTGDGELYAWIYDLSTGRLAAKQRAEYSTYLAHTKGSIYLAADRTVYRFDSDRGFTPLFSFNHNIAHFAFLSNQRLVAELFGDKEGDKRQLVLKNLSAPGSQVRMPLDNRVNSRFLEAFGVLAFTTRYDLVGLDAGTGQELFRTRLYTPEQLFDDAFRKYEYRAVDALEIYQNNIIVQSHDALLSVEPKSGRVLWRVNADQKHSTFFSSITSRAGYPKKDVKCRGMEKPYSSCFDKSGGFSHPDREPPISPSVNHFEKFKNQRELWMKSESELALKAKEANPETIKDTPMPLLAPGFAPINNLGTSSLLAATSPIAAENLQQAMGVMQSRLNLTSAGMGAMAAGQMLMVETQGELIEAGSARKGFRDMLNHQVFGRLSAGSWRFLPMASDLGRGFVVIDLEHKKKASVYIAPHEHENAMDAFINVENFSLTPGGLVAHGIDLDSENWKTDERYMYLTTVNRSLLYFSFADFKFYPIEQQIN